MKRDMELIRKLVLLVEDSPGGWAPSKIEIEGYTPEQIGYHAYLMVDSGLADGMDLTHLGSLGPEYMIQRLTSAGHDFADSARTQYIWDEVMDDMKRKGIVSATLDVVKKMLDKQVKKRLEID